MYETRLQHGDPNAGRRMPAAKPAARKRPAVKAKAPKIPLHVEAMHVVHMLDVAETKLRLEAGRKVPLAVEASHAAHAADVKRLNAKAAVGTVASFFANAK